MWAELRRQERLDCPAMLARRIERKNRVPQRFNIRIFLTKNHVHFTRGSSKKSPSQFRRGIASAILVASRCTPGAATVTGERVPRNDVVTVGFRSTSVRCRC
jgi:hypothetical protein